jgi:hypothetical protein
MRNALSYFKRKPIDFLGAMLKNCEERFVMSHGITRFPTDGLLWNLVGIFTEICRPHSILVKIAKNNRHITRKPKHIYVNTWPFGRQIQETQLIIQMDMI